MLSCGAYNAIVSLKRRRLLGHAEFDDFIVFVDYIIQVIYANIRGDVSPSMRLLRTNSTCSIGCGLSPGSMSK